MTWFTAHLDTLKKHATIPGALLLLIVVIGLFLPSAGVVERSIQIAAPAATVFALANDFHQFNQWSPWQDGDPNAKVTYDGPRRGPGASMTWSSTILGDGAQTIVDSVPYERVTTNIELNGSRAQATLELSQTPDGTFARWEYRQAFGFNVFARYYGLALDGAIGPDYEQGLLNLKSLAERMPPFDFADLELEHVDVDAVPIAYLPTSSEPLAQAVSTALGNAYLRVSAFIDQQGLRETGAPMSISRAFEGAELRFDAAVPVTGLRADTPRESQGVKLGSSYGGPAVRAAHIGPYVSLVATHDKISAYLAASGLRRNGSPWESYVTDPTQSAPEELVTYVYYPIQPED